MQVAGIDGARKGWVVAVYSTELSLHFITSLDELTTHPLIYDCILIDMIIGLPSHPAMIRPEASIHALLGTHSASLFRVPCRASVYAETKAEQYRVNEETMHQKMTPFSINLIPKIRQLDEWLHRHPNLQSIIFESHPETAFQLLNGAKLRYSKHTVEGQLERLTLLQTWLPNLTMHRVDTFRKTHAVQRDDILDAIVLAWTAYLHHYELTQIVPEHPMQDETGLWMRTVLPRQKKTLP